METQYRGAVLGGLVCQIFFGIILVAATMELLEPHVAAYMEIFHGVAGIIKVHGGDSTKSRARHHHKSGIIRDRGRLVRPRKGVCEDET